MNLFPKDCQPLGTKFFIYLKSYLVTTNTLAALYTLYTTHSLTTHSSGGLEQKVGNHTIFFFDNVTFLITVQVLPSSNRAKNAVCIYVINTSADSSSKTEPDSQLLTANKYLEGKFLIGLISSFRLCRLKRQVRRLM